MSDDQEQLSKSQSRKKTFLLILRIINVVNAIIIIGFSVLSFGFIIIKALFLEVFLLPSPIFMTGFGICLLAAQFKVRYIIRKVPLIQSLLSRGLFYIYLSSIMYYFFLAMDQKLIGWISGISLLVSGIVNIGIHFGCSKTLKKEDLEDEQDDTFKERLV